MTRSDAKRTESLIRTGYTLLRSGFTLVEMVVTISIIAILAAILVPTVAYVRETARDMQCKSNLRQIGQGLMQYSARSPSGQYCSGAWDWQRDGAVTQYGWVADMVLQGMPVGDMLCPSNDRHLSTVYQQLLTMNPTTNTCADSLGGPDQTLPDGTVVSNPCRQLATASNRATIIDELVLQKKFNTNYTAGWFLVRGEVDIDNRGALINGNPGCAGGVREPGCTAGPVTTARVGAARVPANIVPILGCGGDPLLKQSLLGEVVGAYESSERLADSYTAGPRDPSTLGLPSIPGSGVGPPVWFGPWNATLQDYRSFGPVHGGKNRASCNLLFLDGGVRGFVDENGDGILNNGFPASVELGFIDDVVELSPAEVHSLWSLDASRLP